MFLPLQIHLDFAINYRFFNRKKPTLFLPAITSTNLFICKRKRAYFSLVCNIQIFNIIFTFTTVFVRQNKLFPLEAFAFSECVRYSGQHVWSRAKMISFCFLAGKARIFTVACVRCALTCFRYGKRFKNRNTSVV